MDESALQLSDSNIDQLTRALFEDADVDKSGTITFEELQAELDKHPGVIENLTIRFVLIILYTTTARLVRSLVLTHKIIILRYFKPLISLEVEYGCRVLVRSCHYVMPIWV